eukprot:UN14933
MLCKARHYITKEDLKILYYAIFFASPIWLSNLGSNYLGLQSTCLQTPNNR